MGHSKLSQCSVQYDRGSSCARLTPFTRRNPHWCINQNCICFVYWQPTSFIPHEILRSSQRIQRRSLTYAVVTHRYFFLGDCSSDKQAPVISTHPRRKWKILAIDSNNLMASKCAVAESLWTVFFILSLFLCGQSLAFISFFSSSFTLKTTRIDYICVFGFVVFVHFFYCI